MLYFIKPKSYSAIKGFVKKINTYLGKYKLRDITTNQIQEFLNGINRSRRKEKICIYFKAILQNAVDTNYLDKNPFNAVIKDKKLKLKNDAYNYADQVKILNAIKETDIEHEIMLYLMCGCRPNEIPSKKDFDFENNLVSIHGTKNENAKLRIVDMSEQFSNYMKQYLKNNDIQAEKYISRKFIDICTNIGIEKPLLYRLRHTFASNHFTIGTPPKQVQHWMGHSSISITLDTYTDIDRTATKQKIIELYNNFYYIKK